jgi:hypothetical protein
MKRARTFRREFTHGAMIPRGWQMAWYEPRRRVGVYYRPPLHWLMRTSRELLHRVRTALRSPEIECLQVFEMQRTHRERERLADEYARGYMAGWRECFQTCLTAVEEELTAPGDVWEIGAVLVDSPGSQKEN